jgi:glycosyltransferase involved in cell wall biosynthesis
VGHWLQGDLGHDRKNVGLLIKLFCETFKNKPSQPALILKSSHGGASYMDRDLILEKIKQVKSTVVGKLPKIYLLHGEFTDEEMNELYNHSKVKAMVSLTKGEGFGRPLLEFTQTKKPILTTNWSGHVDFLKPDMSPLINGTLGKVHKSAANKWTIAESQWFDVNQGEVSKYLKLMFKKPNLFKENAKKQGYFCKTNFSFEKMKEKLGDILEEKIKAAPQQVSLNLPKLKKVGSNSPQPQSLKLPKLKKIGETNSPSKIKLPKLKKVEA